MIKNLLRQEKGIALTIAAFVMVVLLLIAIAFFISTQSEFTKVLADKAGVSAIAAANVGAERAIWLVQQKLDDNTNWQPNNDTNWNSNENELPLFNTEYNYFNFKDLSSQDKNERMNPEKYAKKCIQIGATQPGITSGSIGGEGSQVYAVKMQQEDDPNTNPIEWAIYSIGVDRTPSILGAKAGKMEVRVAKVIVQLGTPEGMPNTPMNTPGNVETTEGQRIHIGGPPLPNGPVVRVGNWDDADPLDNPIPRFQAKNPQRPQQPAGWGDGWYKRDDFTMEISTQGPPNIDLSIIGPPDSGAIIEADYYINADLSVKSHEIRNLLHPSQGWGTVTNNDGSITLVPPHGQFEGDFRDVCFFGRHINAGLVPDGVYLRDINEDGYTIIYIPPRDPNNPNSRDVNIRLYDVIIMPETAGDICRAIIVSRGRGSNLHDGADSNGYVHLQASPPFPGLPPGERLIAADKQRNSFTAIDIRGIIKPYNLTSHYSFWDFIWDDVNKEMLIGSINYGEVSYSGTYKLDRRSGALSLLADYDIIISTPDANDGGDPGDPQSIFRGLIYSKRNVIIQEDLLLRGAIMGGENIDFVDQSGLWPSQRGSGDGFDIAICHENAFDSSDGTRNILHRDLRPQGAGTGKIQILAWENISGYKQIQDTF